MSKLRALLRALDVRGAGIQTALHCYDLQLPAQSWIDVEAASEAVHRAESALRTGDRVAVWSQSAIAYQIAKRPFLPAEDGTWVERQWAALHSMLARAIECLAGVSLGNGEATVAAALAEELVDFEPFRETGYQILMRAHAAAGNRAQALQTDERCRALLAEELGADPSPETQAIYLEVLTAT